MDDLRLRSGYSIKLKNIAGLLSIFCLLYSFTIGRNTVGVTLCFPGLSPLVLVHPLGDNLEETITHEYTHALQGERLGCVAMNQLRATPEGELELEAEAFCAERRGAEEVVSDLMSFYPKVAALGENRVRQQVMLACAS